ncbi:plasmid replication protein RepC [Phyllobacterium endophyticum]|uniref:plasmid replication protein RepC n=1 Tax=Phyllobacterium endophyticum TaxID=1149773 RepID=UPI0011CC981F|nr:plasmid replication protein RepC [Phyllobacterium endophyticum]TXR49477.1 replication initiation protein RepC [Phyllobacterium endophyticum]
MLGIPITTPFGGRAMTLAHLKAQHQAREIEEGKNVDKWQLYRWLCEAKSIVGVRDRSLAVLNALLSFLPDDELSEDNGLVVFPSNIQLSLRAHGMAPATLRRHLAMLVECGLITRKDSPNGKRYSRKDRAGEITDAFGFSLAPLLARAEELQNAAASVRASAMALRLIRERMTLHRRDIAKLIEIAVAQDIPGHWADVWIRFRAVVDAIPRRATIAALEPFLCELAVLHEEVAKALENHVNTQNASANESNNERQQQNSHTDTIVNSEPRIRTDQEATLKQVQKAQKEKKKVTNYPLSMVMKACPEIADYAINGIGGWSDLIRTATQVRGYLGISPSTYNDAVTVLGIQETAIVIACMLRRIQSINSAGAYLRTLTDKARAGEFSVGQMLMAALRSKGSHLQLVPK